MKNEPDFGYFGKGLTGYAHYMQTYNQCFPEQNKKPVQRSCGFNCSSLKDWGMFFAIFIPGMLLYAMMSVSSQYIASLFPVHDTTQGLIQIVIMIVELVLFMVIGLRIIKNLYG
ncbi:MAG: hypothetical protein R3Y06_06545 [Faecalibacterium sp.]